MAMKKTTPKPARPGGNPGGRASVTISPSVKVLGSKLSGFTGVSNPPRKPLTASQLKEAEKLAAKIKAFEVKVANEKKANAKIIKKQNKTKPLRPDPTKANIKGNLGKKPVIKLTGRGMGGMRGGGGGGLFGFTRIK